MHSLPSRTSTASDEWPIALAGPSQTARRLRETARDLALTARGSLIVAPSGFDPASLAQAIHHLSSAGGPCVVVECGGGGRALEEQLFGVVPPRRGATNVVESLGADAAIAVSRGGTLVLVGVNDLPVSAQSRLARLLRDGEARVNGGVRAVPLELRVVATSEMALEPEVRQGRFRSDLYKRLSAHVLELKPLRDRREDIGPMATALMAEAARDTGVAPRPFTNAALALVSALAWEGNLVELERFVRELLAAGGDAPIRVEDVIGRVDPGAVAIVGAPHVSLREARRQFEREYIAAVLRHSGWRMGQAARVLGIQRTNLYRKARQLGIARAKVPE